MTHDEKGRPMSDIQAAKAVAETIDFALTYPMGQPEPIAVTLTDEEWVAVKAFLQVGLIIQNTDDMQFAPDYIADLAHGAWHKMHEQVKEVLRMLAKNEEREQSLGKEGPS